MFYSEETVEDTSNTTPIVEEALSVKESHRNLGSRDSVEVSPSNGEPRDKITQEEHISTHNSPAEVENVTSENEDVKEDSAAVVVYEEVFEVHTEVETLKQGDKQVLRQTTIFSTKTVESIQQKSDKETNENTLQTIGIVGELAVTDPDPEERQVLSDDILVMEKQLKDEELQNEELTGNKHEFGVKDAILQEISSENHMSDDETEEPPVVQRRGRQRVNPLSTKHRQHKEEGEHTHEAEPIAGQSLGRKEADEKAMYKQMEDQHQEETDQSMDRTPETSAQELLVVEDGRTPGAQESQEDAITSTQVRIEINKDDIKEMPPEMDSEKQELTDDGNKETGAICGDNLDQPTASVPDEIQLTKDCEMPRLQQARVILVDLKTGSDYVSLIAAEETIEVQCLASEREEVELTADEKMDEDPETALQPSTEEENDDLEVNGNKGKEDSSNENHEEEEPFIETIFLRSGRKITKVCHQEHQHDAIAAVSTGDKDHEKEIITNDSVTGEDSVVEKQFAEEASTQPKVNEEIRLEEDEAPVHLQPSIQVSMVKICAEVEVDENKTDDGEIAGIENGDKSVDQGKEKPKAEVKVMDDPTEQAMAMAGSETCPNEQAEPSKEVSEINISAKVEAQTEKETPVRADVDESPVTLSEDQENTDDSTSPDTVQASNLEEPIRASKEKPHSEEMDLQESDLHRVTVVVVELRNSNQLLDDNIVTDSSVAEEQPAVEVEEALREDGQTEAAPDVPVKASSVSEEAITTQNKQSEEEDEAEGVSGRRVLRSVRKTGNIRTQRKGRSAAATPQGKSKRAQTKEESEEQETDKTIPTLEELTEEPKIDLEDVPQKEPSKEQDVQEENAGVGVAQEEEEEMQLHCEEADESSQDEPTSIGTALRKAKRTAPATSTHKSKRSCMQHESEEETLTADREVEDTKTDDGEIAEIENGDKSVHQGEEKLKDMGVVSAEATTGTNSETHSNGEGENYLSETASAPVTVVEGDTDENEAPVVATHVCGNNGNTINASAGTILLNCQIEENEEERRETHSGPDEPEQRLVIHAEEQIIEVPQGEEEELVEETTSMENEIKIDGARDQIIGSDSACPRGVESENFSNEPPVEVLETGTEVYGTSRGMEAEITEIDVEPPTAAPQEDHLLSFDEEAPTVTSRSQKSRTKRPKTTPKRTSRRWKKQGLLLIQQHFAESGDDKMQGKPEDPGETSQPHEPSGFILEESDMKESVEGDITSVESEKDIGSNSELNADEDGKEFNLEVENNLLDDDGELIVTGEKVLRGRTVQVTITPQSKSRRHRIKEFLSEEEKTPQSALKKKPLKRKGTEATQGHRSKRHSR